MGVILLVTVKVGDGGGYRALEKLLVEAILGVCGEDASESKGWSDSF